MLCPPISVAEATAALDCLKELGMLVQADDGVWEPREVRVTTPHEVAKLAVQNYHEGMLGLAMGAIDRFPAEERHFRAVTAHVPQSLIPKLKSELNSMCDRLLELVDGTTDAGDEVVQFHVLLSVDVGGERRPLASETSRRPNESLHRMYWVVARVVGWLSQQRWFGWAGPETEPEPTDWSTSVGNRAI